MKKEFVFLAVAFLGSFAVACHDESSGDPGCIVENCEKPANAAEMACADDGCFVKSCIDGYEVSDDTKSCVESGTTPTTPSSCDASECTKPDNASEMTCSDGKCVVRSCVDGYEVSKDAKTCVKPGTTPTTPALCEASECAKPDNASEMTCSDDKCVVKSCVENFKISQDGQSCIKIEEATDTCVPAKCAKPEHASEMACGSEGCFVKTCENDYIVSENGASCVKSEGKCIASQCAMAENATEMACVDNACAVKSCSRHFVVSDDAKSCVCPKPDSKCDKSLWGFTKCCDGSEFKCDYDGYGGYKWWSNVCSKKYDGGICSTYTYVESGWNNSVASCVKKVRNGIECTYDTLERIAHNKKCFSAGQWGNQFYTFVCHAMDDGSYAYVGEPEGAALEICKDENTKYICNDNLDVVEEPCKGCKRQFLGGAFTVKCKE